MLRRWARQISVQTGLEEEQWSQIEEQVVRQWTNFLDENRGQIQPLLNEFLELRLGLEPPEEQRVQDWAERVTPVFQYLRRQLEV